MSGNDCTAVLICAGIEILLALKELNNNYHEPLVTMEN